MNLRAKWISGTLLVGLALVGCADSTDNASDVNETGTLLFPLVSQGPSGTQYQLRNANFAISSYYYYYDDLLYASAGAAGGSTGPLIVSSETNPGAPSIEVSVERGSYYVNLLPGWTMEKVENGIATPVEAQLLSSQTQYLYVSPRNSTWVKFQFGIGERSVWFNGTASIEIEVFENPDQYYGVAGGSGVGGSASFGGSTSY